jgi:SAM-dependent methyltransferase
VNELDGRYISDDYVNKNPTWDLEDSPWKASLVTRVLRDKGISPVSICDVGCGAGRVLLELRSAYPDAELFGFDIAPAAERFWREPESAGARLTVGDFLALNNRTYDVLLILDVLEHLGDPRAFLMGIRGAARHYVLHIPLDLSALSVAREQPLLTVRRKVGHIHYFTKNLALSLIEESGFRVTRWGYTGAAFKAPQRTWKTRLAMAPRWVAQRYDKDWAVRALGGETLIVLAEAAEPHGSDAEFASPRCSAAGQSF